MKSTFSLIAALLAFFTHCTIAQYNNITSKPFYLVLLSDDATYNGTALGSCHEGAAIEGLCTGAALNATSGYSTFNFNTSANQFVANRTLGKTGVLTWTLHGSNFVEPETMQLAYNPSSNIAMPLFTPGDEDAIYVAFDSEHRLNIQSYVDDTTDPPTDVGVTAYYRWYVCETNYSGYVYETLAWLMGDGTPENPSCCKVDVVRVFV